MASNVILHIFGSTWTEDEPITHRRTPGIQMLVSARELTPAEQLCATILEDAVSTLRRGGHTPARDKGESAASLLADTRAWVASNADRWIFDFVRICHALGLDPAHVRRLVAADERAHRGAIRRKRPRRVDHRAS